MANRSRFSFLISLVFLLPSVGLSSELARTLQYKAFANLTPQKYASLSREEKQQVFGIFVKIMAEQLKAHPIKLGQASALDEFLTAINQFCGLPNAHAYDQGDSCPYAMDPNGGYWNASANQCWRTKPKQQFDKANCLPNETACGMGMTNASGAPACVPKSQTPTDSCRAQYELGEFKAPDSLNVEQIASMQVQYQASCGGNKAPGGIPQTTCENQGKAIERATSDYDAAHSRSRSVAEVKEAAPAAAAPAADNSISTGGDAHTNDTKKSKDEVTTAQTGGEHKTAETSQGARSTSFSPPPEPTKPLEKMTDLAKEDFDEHGTGLKQFHNKIANGDPEATKAAKDPCKVSTAVDRQYSCAETKDFIETTEMASQLAQVTGSLTTQVMTASASMKAQQQGTQSAALKGSADTMSTAAMMQMTMGAASAAAGAYEYFSLRKAHEANAKKFTVQLAEGQGHVTVVGVGEKGDAGGYRAMTLENSKNTGQDAGQSGYAESGNELGKLVMSKDMLGKNSNKRWALGAMTATGITDPKYEEQQKDRYKQALQKQDAIRKNMVEIGSAAVSEQEEWQKAAKMAGIKTMIAGAVQLGSGLVNNMAANQMKKAADQLSKAEHGAAAFVPTAGNQLGGTDALAPRQGTAIGGNGLGRAPDGSGATGDETKTDEGLTLGDPTGMPQGPQGLAGPPPAAAQFRPGTPPSGGSGGGGGINASNTSPSTGAATDDTARLADNRGGASYEGGGSYHSGGGGAGGGDKGLDLSGMLAQFLPKKDEDGGTKNGILDFGGRVPASLGDDSGSLLGRNANIFERIHQTYQDKSRKMGL